MSKIKIILFSAILVLTIALPILAIPSADAHTPPWKIPTFAYIAVSPDPVGVGQQALIVFWMAQLPPTATGDHWRQMAKPKDSHNKTRWNEEKTGSVFL